jgi:hypothetical protein
MELEIKQSEQEYATVAMVKTWYRDAKAAFAKRREVIEKCYRYYKGEHFTQAAKLKKNGPKSTRNYIFSSVEDALSLLTDNKPSLDCWPREMRDIQIAEKTKQVLDWVWERTAMDKKLPMAIKDHIIAGTGYLKVYYDHEQDYPNGEIAVDVVHPFNLLPDPDAINLDTAKYVIQDTPVPLWLIRERYPERGIYVKPDESVSLSLEDAGHIPADVNKEVEGVGSVSDANHYRARLLEVWVRDNATLDEDELDAEGNVTRKKGQMKYPNGRRIVVAGDILLEDGENPFIDGRFPYVPIVNYEITDSFWPLGDVEHLIEISNDINKIVSRLNEYIRTTAHTHVILKGNTGIDPDSLDNIEGTIIFCNEEGSVSIQPPPPFPASVFEFLTSCMSSLEIISGIREVLQGRDPASGKSGVAFERLQEFALSRVRKKARSIDNSLIKLGELFISRIKQFYSEERQVRITGDFPITDEMGNMSGARQYDFITISNGEFFETDEQGNVVREVQLDVVLEVGVAATVSRSRDRADAMMLFQSGIIDAEEVAKRYDVKNYKEIQARIEQKQRQMMEQSVQNVLAKNGVLGQTQGLPPEMPDIQQQPDTY